MNQQDKVLKPKLGVLELAKQLGNVSQACKIMGYSRDTFYRYKSCTTPEESRPCRRSREGSPS